MLKYLLLLVSLASTQAFATNYPIGLNPTAIVTNGDMSAVSITSDPIPITGLDNINIQCVWTGTPTGTFKVNVSLDGSTWDPLPPAIAAGGAPGSFSLDLNQIGSYYFEIVYTMSGSTGVLNCKAYGKKV